MGNSVKRMFQKKETISYSKMDNKEVCRFNIFMKHCYNAIQGNEEQNPLAGESLLLLEQLVDFFRTFVVEQKLISEKAPGFDMQNIFLPIRQVLLYKSPRASQRMVVARYSVWLKTENRNVLQQSTSRSQMLVWNCSVPPPQRFTSASDWHIVSIEIVIDKIDIGVRDLDNKNPLVHLKVFIHIGRITRPPIAANNIDPGFSFCNLNINLPTYNNGLNPCFSKYCGVNTLTPEESNQLDRLKLIDRKLKYLEDASSIPPDPTKYNKDAIQVAHRNPNTSQMSNNKNGLIPNILNCVNSIVHNPPLFNTGAIYKDRQDQSTYIKSKKRSTSTIITKGVRTSSIINASICCLILLCPNTAASSVTGRQIKFVDNYDSGHHQNCTLETSGCSICAGDCHQSKEEHGNKCNVNSSDVVQDVCISLKNFMKTNMVSSIKEHDFPSGTFQQILICQLDAGFNVTHESVYYILYGPNSTKIEIADPPMPVLKDYKLCERIRNGLLPFLNKSDQLDAKAPLSTEATAPLSTATVAPLSTATIVSLSVIAATVFIAAIIVSCLIYHGKISCKNAQKICTKSTYRRAARTDADGESHEMEAPEGENHETSPV